MQGSYHYNQMAKRQERLRLEIRQADLEQVAATLEPLLREPGLLARLPFTKRTIPDWMKARNLEGDLVIDQLRFNKNDLGPVNTHFIWQGTNVNLTALNLRLPGAH